MEQWKSKLPRCVFAALRDKIRGSKKQLAVHNRQSAIHKNQTEFKLRLCAKNKKGEQRSKEHLAKWNLNCASTEKLALISAI